MPSTSWTMMVLPNRTASSSWATTLASCCSTVSLVPVCCFSQSMTWLFGSTMKGTISPNLIITLFSCESRSDDRPCAFHVSSSLSLDITRSRSKPSMRACSIQLAFACWRTSSETWPRYVQYAAERHAFVERSSASCLISCTCCAHRCCSPDILDIMLCAFARVALALSRSTFRTCASPVRSSNSVRSSDTFLSMVTSCCLYSSSLPFEVSSTLCASFSAFSIGATLTSTELYLTHAVNHLARGAAATDTR
mmetsp:Transcript_36470/g.104340  ORF Transcript_36470/g.104340 Transcript_36470/m.104340 type:complete len:251 (+) Transcript_36470:623-1375(+)